MHIKAPLKVPIKAQICFSPERKVKCAELPSHENDLNQSFILTQGLNLNRTSGTGSATLHSTFDIKLRTSRNFSLKKRHLNNEHMPK